MNIIFFYLSVMQFDNYTPGVTDRQQTSSFLVSNQLYFNIKPLAIGSTNKLLETLLSLQGNPPERIKLVAGRLLITKLLLKENPAERNALLLSL